MKKHIKDIVYILGFIILLLILKSWFKDKIITMLGGYTTKETKVVTKVKYKKGKIDTVAVFNTYVKTKGIILNPKPIIKYKYIYSNPETKVKEEIDSVKVFNVKVKDTLIDGVFTVFNKFDGDLLNTNFEYKPLFPKYITRVDTLIVTNTITETLTKDRTLLGLGIGYTAVNKLHYPSLQGSILFKNNLQVIAEYGKPLNNTQQIINGQPFTILSEDLFSVKLIKHF